MFSGWSKGKDRQKMINTFSVKSVHIRSYSGPHFPAFRLNTERYSVFERYIREIVSSNMDTPNTDTFHAMIILLFFINFVRVFWQKIACWGVVVFLYRCGLCFYTACFFSLHFGISRHFPLHFYFSLALFFFVSKNIELFTTVAY